MVSRMNLLESILPASADVSRPACQDCRDREDCFKGQCVCSGLWGTSGPKCATPSWTTYVIAVHAVVVFLLYRRAAALHWMSLRDHLAGKPEEGWAEAMARCFCLKVRG